LSGGGYFLQKFSRAGMHWKRPVQGKYLHTVQPAPVSCFMSIFFHSSSLAAHSNILSISGIKNINTTGLIQKVHSAQRVILDYIVALFEYRKLGYLEMALD
jgi:hypothetical protein